MEEVRKNRILFGFNTVPYPLRAHGVSVRYLPILEHLSGNHEIDLILINGSGSSSGEGEHLQRICRKLTLIPDPRGASHGFIKRSITYTNYMVPWTSPLSMVAHNGMEVTRGIVEATRNENYDVVVWVGAYLLPNMISALSSISTRRVVVDFIDSPYLWLIRSERTVSRLPFLEQYERWKTRNWERGIIRRADATIYISHVDAGAIPAGIAEVGKTHVIPNGINIPSVPNGRCIALPSPNIGFLGNMMYPPNVEAVKWLYEKVFAPLKGLHPELTLVLVGRDPHPAIQLLGENQGVIVTGTVENIWEYINAIDVFLFPLHRGAGLKNKILEAMYAGRPVVTTEIGNEGVDAVDGRDIAIRKTPEEFRMETLRLLQSPDARQAMGDSAHSFVRDRFSWERILPRYEEIVIGAGNRKQADPVLS